MAKKKQVRKLFRNYDGNFPSPRELAKRNNQIKLVRQTDLLGGNDRNLIMPRFHFIRCYVIQPPSSSSTPPPQIVKCFHPESQFGVLRAGNLCDQFNFLNYHIEFLFSFLIFINFT